MSNKWEREIEELLRKKYPDEDKPARPKPAPRPIKRRDPQPRRQRHWASSWLGWSPEKMMLYGLGAAAAAYFLRQFLGPATLLLVILSVSLIAGAVVVSVLQRERPYVEKRWRGQIVELPQQRRPLSSAWRRLRYKIRLWLNGKR